MKEGSSSDTARTARRVLASERHKARHFAMQGLYQWHHTGDSGSQIESQFRVDFDMKGTDLDYFRELLKGVQSNAVELDELLAPHASERELSECDPVTRSLLRIAAFELQHRIDVPCKVVINEAVSLAKKFGPEESHKFVNGLLDKLARQLRSLEFNANNASG